MTSFQGQLYTNSKRGQKWLIKGSFWQYWPSSKGQNWLIKGHFTLFFLSRMTPLLVNFDPLLELVYSWLLIFKCVTFVIKFDIANGFFRVTSIPKLYTFIYITVIVRKLQLPIYSTQFQDWQNGLCIKQHAWD